MGENAAETVKEIEEVRGDLDGKLRTLESRLPAPTVWAKRLAGAAVGGGAGGTVFWFVVRRVRNRRKKTQGRPKGASGPTVVELSLPTMDAQAAKPWLIGLGAAWVVLRLAQLRQARRTNHLLARSVAA
jgi:hypothetical protein